MSDIATKLNYLRETKNRIKQAIMDKGVSVTDTDTFRDYADKIADISSGGESDTKTIFFQAPTKTLNATFVSDGIQTVIVKEIEE